MATLTMHPNAGCIICGCRLQGIRVGTFRINKGSLVAKRGTLVYLLDKCPECQHPTPRDVERWRLDEDSQRIVDEARAKRGWS